MKKRSTVTVFVVVGLAVALALAFFVSPYASSDPDGLERVAIDNGFDSAADEHAMADSPLADYGVDGVDDSKLSTGLAGVIGVALCFAIGALLFFVIRVIRKRQATAAAAPDVPASTTG